MVHDAVDEAFTHLNIDYVYKVVDQYKLTPSRIHLLLTRNHVDAAFTAVNKSPKSVHFVEEALYRIKQTVFIRTKDQGEIKTLADLHDRRGTIYTLLGPQDFRNQAPAALNLLTASDDLITIAQKLLTGELDYLILEETLGLTYIQASHRAQKFLHRTEISLPKEIEAHMVISEKKHGAVDGGKELSVGKLLHINS